MAQAVREAPPKKPPAATGTAPSPEPKRNAPRWLKALVAWHLFAITVWALPWPPEGILRGTVQPVGSDNLLVWNNQYLKSLPPLRAYLFTTGFWQYWDMFSPNPIRSDHWGTAEIVYRDGSKREVAYPRMAPLPIPEKYLKERYRKFYERVHLDDNAYLWPSFAERLAHLHADPANPAARVRLYRHWQTVGTPADARRGEVQSYMFYEHLL